MNKIPRAQSGFTLIELLLATTVLFLAVVPILGLQSTLLDRVYKNERELQATLLAQSMLSGLEISRKIPERLQIDFKPGDKALEELYSLLSVASAPRQTNETVWATFDARVELTNYELPGLQGVSIADLPTNVRLLTLTIRWGLEETENIQIFYILPPIS